MKKYTELLTVPFAILLLLLFNFIGKNAGWHLYGIEMLQKPFLALIYLLIIIGTARLLLFYQFPTLFRLISRDFNPAEKWNALTQKEKTWIGVIIFLAYCFFFSMLVSGI